MTFELVLGGIAALYAIAIAIWGWRYGRKPSASLPGLGIRWALLITVGSWSLGIAAGHGVGIGPVPALACLPLDTGRTFRCLPPGWVVPLCASVIFVGTALLSGHRARNRVLR